MNRTQRRGRRQRLQNENERMAQELVNLQEYVAELEHARTHDDLCPTLLNRIGFDKAAEQIWARTRSGDAAEHWVGMVDLDSFKTVNDSYGHAVGDVAIQGAAGRLTAMLGGRGTIARLGGDEFAFFTNKAGLDALHIASRGRGLSVTIEPGPETRSLKEPVTVTMSVGVAAYHPWVPFGAVMHAADCAMYDAKRIKGEGSLVIHRSINGAQVQVRPLHRIRDQRHDRTAAAS